METEEEWRAWKHLQCLLWISKLEAASLLLNWLFYKHILNRTVWLRPDTPFSNNENRSRRRLRELIQKKFHHPTSAAEWSRGLSSVTNCIYHHIQRCIALINGVHTLWSLPLKFKRCKEGLHLEDRSCLHIQWRKIIPCRQLTIFWCWEPCERGCSFFCLLCELSLKYLDGMAFFSETLAGHFFYSFHWQKGMNMSVLDGTCHSR